MGASECRDKPPNAIRAKGVEKEVREVFIIMSAATVFRKCKVVLGLTEHHSMKTYLLHKIINNFCILSEGLPRPAGIGLPAASRSLLL
jgi:hypothetical protein